MTDSANPTKAGTLRILHLEDDIHDVELVGGWLEDEGLCCEVKNVQTPAEFEAALGQGQVDLIISDYSLPMFDGLKALGIAKERLPDVPFILFSGTIGEEAAVESLRQGAANYVLKQRPQRLIAAVRQALANAEQRAKGKEAENRVRAQAALLDKAQDAIMVCDMERRITFWNRSAERIYGWNALQAIGQNVDRFLSNGDLLKVNETLKAVNEHGEWQGELNQVRRDGTQIIVESRWSLVCDSKGRPEANLIINTDVTERKRLQDQFLRSQRMESIGALAGGIAHDLNNMLAPILMAVDLLGRGDLKVEERKMMLATAKSCAQRGAEMVKQILSFARGAGGQAGPLIVKPVIVEMARLAKDTFPRSILIQVKVEPELPTVFGNATQLHQVLLNLCVNARDAMPNGGSLELSAKKVTLNDHVPRGEQQAVSGDYVVLSVSDTGQGISEDVAARIFEPFFTTKAEGKGTGLGLSTVIGIARNHNGFVEFATKAGAGTSFSVYFPAVGAQEVPSGSPKEAAVPMGRGERILVVDDEIAFLEMTRESLEAFNYRVLMAQNGAEALTMYDRYPGQINAVITDMMMPVMDGPTSIQALKRIDPAVKVIGVSGLGSEAVLARAGKENVQTFLRKPYSTASLITALREVLNEEI